MSARIKALDSFRAIAIILVLFFHFFSRWAPPESSVSLYPYNDAYNYFNFGRLGVQFFFIISGFVIAFTLENTEKFAVFWKKRMIRLFPSLLVASLITYVVFSLFDGYNLFPQSHHVKNFVPSLTFVSPSVFNTLLPGHQLDYLNGSYWSLWPEIQFYFLASLIFYCRKENFIKNFTLVSFFIIAFNYVMANVQASNKLHLHLPVSFLSGYSTWILHGFNLAAHLQFFCLGCLFYILFKNKQANVKPSFFVKISMTLLILFVLYTGVILSIRFVYLSMILVFFALVYFPTLLSIFQSRMLSQVGKSSYFLYLIHQNIGVLLINSFAALFMPAGFIFTLLVMLIIIWISNLYTNKIDKKITEQLKGKLI